MHKDIGLRSIRKLFGWGLEEGLCELLSSFDEEIFEKYI